MLIPLYIRSPMGSKERLTDYTVDRDFKIDGERTLTVVVYLTKKNMHAFPLIQNQGIFTYLGEDYVIKQITASLPGQVECTVISKAFEDLSDMFIYTTTSGDLTIQQMLDYCLSGTGYSCTVDTTGLAAMFSASNFGNSDSLSLFQQVMSNFGTEFSINGKQITIAQEISRQTDYQFRYKFNMSSPTDTVDTTNLKTYIKGFGHQYEDGTYAAQIDYTSPLASVYGVKHANPVTDDNCFDNTALLAEVKAALNDTIPLSVSFTYDQIKKMGIQDIRLGDYVWLNVDPWGINMKVRVAEIHDYANLNQPPLFTLGNILVRSTDAMLNMQQKAVNFSQKINNIASSQITIGSKVGEV